MPDFGFWGWPSVGLNSYAELQSILDENEDDFLDKIPKLVWRGALAVAAKDMRQALLKESESQVWSHVRTIVWKNETNVKETLISMQDHCDYMFVVETEGNTYSGRLKYLLNCHSIVMSYDLYWIEHFHHLLRSSGKEQNYVKLRRDFSDPPKTMNRLLYPSTPPGYGQTHRQQRPAYISRALSHTGSGSLLLACSYTRMGECARLYATTLG